jgi:exosortase/archaeosortase family protein
MKNEKYLRISVVLSLILLILVFYPKYENLTSNTVKTLAIGSSYIIGVIPSYQQNTIFYNFKDIITPISVSPECSGLLAMFVFLIVVWLVPDVSIKNRILAFILTPIIYFSNILRLLIAVIIGNSFGSDSVVLYHATIGQLFSFIMLIICFIIFINFSKNKNLNEEDLK